MESGWLFKLGALDRRALLIVQERRFRALNGLFIALTQSGTSKAWLSFALTINVLHIAGWQVVERQVDFLNALYCPLVTWGTSTLLKKLIRRRRPSASEFELRPLIEMPECGSFPSSHAATSFSFFVGLVLLGHPLAAAVGVWAVLVSFSRAYLGVHYVSDIVGGWVLGASTALGMLALLKQFWI